jgi:tetratricopeptide (TPR) repeat protein
MKDRDRYYKILGLETTATPAEVKQAYRRLAKQWHPDRFVNRPQMLAKAQQEIIKINQAYTILKDCKPEIKTVSNFNNDRVVKTSQNPSEIHYQRGVEFAEAEAYENAISEFSLAIKIDHNYLKAYQYRGFILSKLGYELRANSDFETVNKLKIEQKRGVKQRSYRYTDWSKKNKRTRRKWYKLLTNNKLAIIPLLFLLIVTATILL